MTEINYANLLDRLDRGDFEISVAHNAATAIAIHGGTKLVLDDPVSFDPRAEYWHPPERRYFVAFFSTRWHQWPKGDDDALLNLAHSAALHLDAARTAKLISFKGVRYETNLEQILGPLRKHLAAFVAPQEAERLKRGLAGKTPADALREFLDEVISSNFSKKTESGLRENIRWFPFLGAANIADVERRQRFFVAYAHAVMSTNAYVTAGAQYFGSVVHNTPTNTFLDCLKAWREGIRLTEAPLIALDKTEKSASDRSHTNIVRELWGFLNLHRSPFYNSRAGEYAELSGIDDPDAATRKLGEATHGFLAKNPAAVSRARTQFARILSTAKRESERPFAVARRVPEIGDVTSFDGHHLNTIREAGRQQLLARSDSDQAAMLLHLLLDATTYEESVKGSPSSSLVTRASASEKGSRATDGVGSGLLRRAERVWIYSPGLNAWNWDTDASAGQASIGWDIGDLTSFESELDIHNALEDDEDEEGDPAYGARICWQFARDVKIGDPIVARRGRSTIVGIGIVEGGYVYVSGRKHPNVVGVRWLWKGEHLIAERKSLAITTLVESSRRKSLMAELDALLGDEVELDAPKRVPYTLATASADLFVGERWLEHQLTLLRRKKNIILQGPPGVGKTFVAKRLAYLLMGERDDDRVEFVQFHPSYTYEQFVRGYRPAPNGGFKVSNGPLYRIAERAKGDPDAAYVLVIDEINRGHLGKILGEAMMLLESDKRAEEWSVRLAYPDPKASDDGEEETFFIPPNLFVIGTMNTADRSLAVVDYALRRRFAFVSVVPALEEPAFRAHLTTLPTSFVDELIGKMCRLNDVICKDATLGPGFQIGHSYFCRNSGEQASPEEWLTAILHHEIMPLVEEYWYDAPDAVRAARQIVGLDP